MPTTEEEKPVILELITKEESTSMPVLLNDGEQRLLKAMAIVKDFPAITDAQSDKNAATLVAQLEDRMKAFNESRMPFTRRINELVKKFTGVENGYQSLIDQVKKKRDTYTAAELKKSREAQAKVDAELAATQAKITLEASIKEVLRMKINAMLDIARNAAGRLVNEVTKETLEANKTLLSGDPKWKAEKQDPYYYTAPDWITDKAHFTEIATAEFETNKADYLVRAKQIMSDSLGIIEVALTDKAEALRLQETMKVEADKVIAEEETEAQRDLEGQKIIAKLDMPEVAMPKAKIKMKIEILDDEAWVQIFANWWKWDTKKESDKLERKTLLQMKTFVEKHAFDTGEFIEHPSLNYIEDVKAR